MRYVQCNVWPTAGARSGRDALAAATVAVPLLDSREEQAHDDKLG